MVQLPRFCKYFAQAGLVRKRSIYSVLGKKHKYQAYRNYVEMGVDEELAVFYNKTNQAVILGDKRFRQTVRKRPSMNCKPVNKKVYWFGQVPSRF